MRRGINGSFVLITLVAAAVHPRYIVIMLDNAWVYSRMDAAFFAYVLVKLQEAGVFVER